MLKVVIFFNKIKGAKVATVNMDGVSEKALVIPTRSLVYDARGNLKLELMTDRSGKLLRRCLSGPDYYAYLAEKRKLKDDAEKIKLVNEALPVMGTVIIHEEK